MKKINFISKKIEDDYNDYVNSSLNTIVELETSKYDMIEISNIYNEKNYLYIIIKCDTDTIKVLYDYYSFKVFIINNSLPYEKVYINIAKKLITPDYFVYKGDSSKLIKKNIIRLPSESKIYGYNYYIFDKVFFIDIEGKINEDELINKLVNYQESINNINELTNIIKNTINLSDIDISVREEGDSIVIKKGDLVKYNYSLFNDGNISNEIYYDNDKFYLKETKIDEIKDKSYIKRLGVYHGKKES